MTDLVTQVRWDKNELASSKTINSTTTLTLPDLTFTGLIIGRTYRLTMYGWIYFADNNNGADSLAIYYANHNGVKICECVYRDDTEASSDVRYTSGTSNTIFTATATTITFNFYAAVVSTAILLGLNNTPPSYAILEELPLHKEVSIW